MEEVPKERFSDRGSIPLTSTHEIHDNLEIDGCGFFIYIFLG